MQEVAQRDFFRYAAGQGLLAELAADYPWPREKVEVPAWFYLSADTSSSSCTVPLDLVLCRAPQDECLADAWGILSTAPNESATAAIARYHLRVLIEERHRHLKCFWDLAEFTSPNFALVVNQVIFTALTYALLQQQILKRARKALNKATQQRLLEELVPVSDHVTVYADQYYACFHKLDYPDMALSVSEEARQKLRALIGEKKHELHLAFLQGHAP